MKKSQLRQIIREEIIREVKLEFNKYPLKMDDEEYLAMIKELEEYWKKSGNNKLKFRNIVMNAYKNGEISYTEEIKKVIDHFLSPSGIASRILKKRIQY